MGADAVEKITAMDLSTAIPQAFVAELLFTFALARVFLNVTTSKDTAGNSYYPKNVD